MWLVNLGWLLPAHPAALSLPLLGKARGEKRMKKLVGNLSPATITCKIDLTWGMNFLQIKNIVVHLPERRLQ